MSTTRCYKLDQPMSFARTSPEGFGRRLLRILTKGADLVLTWQERADERTRLATLDDHMLRDMGLSRADVERESSLPFWRSQ